MTDSDLIVDRISSMLILARVGRVSVLAIGTTSPLGRVFLRLRVSLHRRREAAEGGSRLPGTSLGRSRQLIIILHPNTNK